VVGASDPTTGQAIVAFVTLKSGITGDDQLVDALRDQVSREISPIAKPRQIMLTPELPKTRSGKIMRRLLRDVAEHRELGDVTTLVDPTVVNMIAERMASGEEAEG
jgi:acetyl-CoA synthetase